MWRLISTFPFKEMVYFVFQLFVGEGAQGLPSLRFWKGSLVCHHALHQPFPSQDIRCHGLVCG